jgi:hypothetical protein
MSNTRALLLLAAAGLVSAALPGCFSSPGTTAPTAAIPNGKLRNTPTAPKGEGVASGLEDLAADAAKIPNEAPAAKLTYAQLEASLADQARLAEEYKKQLDAEARARAAGHANAGAKPPAVAAAPIAPVTPPPAPPAPANAGLDTLAGNTTPTPAPTNSTTPQAAPSTPGVVATGEPVVLAAATAPVDQRFTMAADELARALRERAASSRTPAADYAALAWLDTIRPGVLGSLEAVPASRLLDPRQAKSINVTRDMLSRLVAEPALLGDHERLWRAISDAATPITQARDVRITTVELCTKVTGYGQYEPVTSRNLLAGAPHTLIVYAEVDSFTHRRTVESASSGSTGDSERYTVELGQAVEIWQDADRPTLQKRWGETQVKDVSRRPRRDFYLTVMIDLPSNLSVGAYNLKLMVKDRQRNAQAERTIPFTIIADGALASSGN